MGEYVAASLIFTIRPSAPYQARRAFCALGTLRSAPTLAVSRLYLVGGATKLWP